MGYFSNGTEGAIYEDTFCRRCVHYGPEEGPGCPVWLAHLIHAYDLCNDDPNTSPGKQMLDMLIPPREDGGLNGNGRCVMFVQDEAEEPLSAWVEENVL